MLPGQLIPKSRAHNLTLIAKEPVDWSDRLEQFTLNTRYAVRLPELDVGSCALLQRGKCPLLWT